MLTVFKKIMFSEPVTSTNVPKRLRSMQMTQESIAGIISKTNEKYQCYKKSFIWLIIVISYVICWSPVSGIKGLFSLISLIFINQMYVYISFYFEFVWPRWSCKPARIQESVFQTVLHLGFACTHICERLGCIKA